MEDIFLWAHFLNETVLSYDTTLNFKSIDSYDAFNTSKIRTGIFTKNGFASAIFDGSFIYFIPAYSTTFIRYCKNITNGICNCGDRLTGDTCSECKVGSGQNCSSPCGYCNPETSKGLCSKFGDNLCSCLKNYAGNDCSNCYDNYYGPTCSQRCRYCDIYGGISSCSRIGDGNCNCKPGFEGMSCQYCIRGLTGQFCNITCGLGNCDPSGTNSTNCTRTGIACICKNGFNGVICNNSNESVPPTVTGTATSSSGISSTTTYSINTLTSNDSENKQPDSSIFSIFSNPLVIIICVAVVIAIIIIAIIIKKRHDSKYSKVELLDNF